MAHRGGLRSPSRERGTILPKGKQLFIEGRIQTRKWQDKEGRDRYNTEIVANDVRFLGVAVKAPPTATAAEATTAAAATAAAVVAAATAAAAAAAGYQGGGNQGGTR